MPTPPSIPDEYQVMPHRIPLRLPDFSAPRNGRLWTFAPDGVVDAADWFESFVWEVMGARGRRFLPICRASDGEFLFMFGDRMPSKRLPWHRRAPLAARVLGRRMRRWGGFKASTLPAVSSGQYSLKEVRDSRAQYTELLARIAQRGFLALDLSYGPQPFQEHFFPALRRWLEDNDIQLAAGNYVPFYFVYALLLGPSGEPLLTGANVVVVASASGEKRRRIEDGLLERGAADVRWHPLSASRALYDVVDVDVEVRPDLVLIGAGVGAPNILTQLEPFDVPCIDAGFVLEVLADPALAGTRPFTMSDA